MIKTWIPGRKYIISFFITGLLLATNQHLIGQSCEEMLREARKAEIHGDFFDAYKKYDAALSRCGDAARDEIERKKKAAVGQLEQQRERSENAENEIKQQRDLILAAKNQAEKATLEATGNLRRAENLVRHFSFNGESAAWAYKNGKFAAINNQGDTLTDFIYESPEPYFSGVAVAKVNNQIVFIDSTGKDVSDKFDFLTKSSNGTYFGEIGYKKKIVWGQAKEIYDLTNSWDHEITDRKDSWINIYKDNLTGLISADGKKRILPAYDAISRFHAGIALAARKSKCGIIDTNGIMVIPLIYDQIFYFRDTVTAMKLKGKYGLINISGKVVVPPTYASIGIFSEGFASFRHEGFWGFINAEGKIITAAKYDLVRPFSEGVAAVQRNGMWGYIKPSGEEFIAPQYDKVFDFYEGMARVYKNGKYGFVDLEGNELISIIYDKEESIYGSGVAIFIESELFGMPPGPKEKEKFDFVNGRALALKGGKYGMIDRSGKEIVPFIYDRLDPFKDSAFTTGSIFKREWGYLSSDWYLIGKSGVPVQHPSPYKPEVIGNGFWAYQGPRMTDKGLVNQTGKLLGNDLYQQVGQFQNERAPVLKNGRWGMIDQTGNIKVPCVYDEIRPFLTGLSWVRKNERSYFIGQDGKDLYTPFRVKDIFETDLNNFTLFSEGKKMGVFNAQMKEIVKPDKYSHISEFKNGVAVVNIDGNPTMGYTWINGRNGLIDTTGKEILPLEYDEINLANEQYFSVKKNNKWGIVNLKGVLLVEPLFDEEIDISEGRAIVKKNGKYGVIDENGHWICSAKYDRIRPYSNGFAAICTKRLKNKRWLARNKFGAFFLRINIFNRPLTRKDTWGFMNNKGEVIVRPIFNSIGDMESGWTQFGNKGKIGFIDSTGKILITPQYGWVSKINASKAIVSTIKGNQIESGKILIDKSGHQILDTKYEQIKFIRDGGLLLIKQKDMWGLAEENGKLLTKFEFDDIQEISDSALLIKKQNQFGLLDYNGVIRVPLKYSQISCFKDSFFIVQQDKKKGIININDEIIVPVLYEDYKILNNEIWFKNKSAPGVKFQSSIVKEIGYYEDLTRTVGAYSIVSRGNKQGLLDSLNREIIPCEFNTIQQIGLNAFLLEQNGFLGLFSPSHGIYIKPNFEQLGLSGEENNWVRVQQNSKWGWVDQSGRIVIPCLFDVASPFKNGKAIVMRQPYSDFFYINTKGEMLLTSLKK